MEVWRYFVGVIFPYIAAAVFVIGIAYRIRIWLKLPAPPMTLFPAPPDEKANLKNTVKEAFLFRSLRRGDPVLWAIAWAFHVVLALILLGHLRVFFNVDRLFLALGMTEDQIQAMSGSVGGVAGAVILATAVMLLLRRAIVPRARQVTGWGDCAILLLIGAIIVTGNMMRFGAEHFDLQATRAYFAALASFRGATQAAVLENGLFLLHMSMALVLIALMPFSKLLHFGGIFFTHQMIRKH